MQNRDKIEHEIEVKRDQLVAEVAEFKDAVLDKVDLKARARRALARGKEEAAELASRARDTARERPALVVAIIAGAAIAIAIGVALERRRNR
jgi:hypothetical protein